MLLIYCPYCEEERSELEFRNAGDAHIARPENIAGISDEEFEEYFFLRDNPKGLIFERWRHIHGCGRFFNAARDTVSDRFYRTYKAGEPKPDISTPLPAAREPVVQDQNAQEHTAEEEGFAK
ncbi:sarcosine oxidase subunit delta [Rhizobium mayense]|uniref:Sarcosine oxidase subunit delta n=1 Tax=Rhizobium mayense TaxID=1312184 RepID=A0ABT7JSJ5_9HYPH|nr:sarcosine oxidase subunit delta [Rhizobium mayense]MDL2399321.1 sarcosine oxidase subunit delta [Rhizobium mayense]